MADMITNYDQIKLEDFIDFLSRKPRPDEYYLPLYPWQLELFRDVLNIPDLKVSN